MSGNISITWNNIKLLSNQNFSYTIFQLTPFYVGTIAALKFIQFPGCRSALRIEEGFPLPRGYDEWRWDPTFASHSSLIFRVSLYCFLRIMNYCCWSFEYVSRRPTVRHSKKWFFKLFVSHHISSTHLLLPGNFPLWGCFPRWVVFFGLGGIFRFGWYFLLWVYFPFWM